MSARLTESQRLALVEVSEGVDLFAHPRTLHSLAAKRLIVNDDGWRVTETGADVARQVIAEWPGVFRDETPGGVA